MIEFGLVPYPSCVEMIVVLTFCLASCVEVVVVGERSCVLLTLYLQISHWRFPVWEVLCGHSGNPSM